MGVFSLRPLCTVNSVEFKLCCPKILKLFSITLKELFGLKFGKKQTNKQQTNKQKTKTKKKAFCSFEMHYLEIQDDFTVKKCKIWKKNLYLTDNWLSRNEMWCVVDIHSYMCHIMYKRIFRF